MKNSALNFCCLFALGVSLLADPSNVVLDWNEAMLDAIRADNSSPTLAPRNLAILHTAVYDAVNSVLRTHQPYKYLEPAFVETSAEAAAVGAAYEVMNDLYPSLSPLQDDLYQKWLT
ncbi:MAG TPA: hypothetical protein VGR78_14240, partial [Verrucomicrobiae bacterium]|nr:hypothetical protein [Verrucomicrobiae bacterium]